MDKNRFDELAIAVTAKTISDVQASTDKPLPQLALVTLTAFSKKLLDNLWEEISK